MLFLINLRDFIGASPANRMENTAAIKSAMDYLATGPRKRHACIVLTQADQYKSLAASKGENGWAKLVEEVLPLIYAAHVRLGAVEVLPVAAVYETRIDAATTRRVPAPGFNPQGMGPLVKWLRKHALAASEMKAAARSVVSPTDRSQQSASSPVGKAIAWLATAAVAAIIVLAIWPKFSTTGGAGRQQPPPVYSPPVVPVPVLVSKNATCKASVLDDFVEVSFTIRNDGASGNVMVSGTIYVDGQAIERKVEGPLFLNAGESRSFQWYMYAVTADQNTPSRISYKCETYIP